MDNLVPGALRRLREADIVSMAGLKWATLGQVYYRIGAVHTTKRQGLQISGIVEVPDTAHGKAASPTNTVRKVEEVEKVDQTEHVDAQPGRYPVKVEIQDNNTGSATCACNIPSDSSYICPHAAALLYYWLDHPSAFLSPSSEDSPVGPRFIEGPSFAQEQGEPENGEQGSDVTPAQPTRQPVGPRFIVGPRLAAPGSVGTLSGGQGAAPLQSGPIPSGDIVELLTQLGLSELRTIAREYDITGTGLNRQQLVEAMLEALKKPDLVRKVVGTLEKPQRQLLAALTLAGGAVSDDDLRGLYERFSLGYPNQLQGMLAALRSKCLLFRTSFNNSLQPRAGLIGSLLEVGWYVPSEVRAALRVTVPITPFDVQTDSTGGTEAPKVQQVRPYSLLEDLLLVARALDRYQLEHDEESEQRDGRGIASPPGRASYPGDRYPVPQTGLPRTRLEHSSLTVPADGLMMVPPPRDMASPALLESLQAVVPRPLAFLRFATRLLRLVDILYEDDAGTPYLHVLPNAARLLLGPTRAEVARDLFARWLTQPTYAELFELQEEGLQLRCRSGPLGRPALHPGELETENSEARHMLVSLLAKVPLDQWVNFSAFARFVYRLNPTFLQKRQNTLPSWWLEQNVEAELASARPLRPTQLNDWLRVEGRYLARLLRGPLHWWGLTDLALSNNGQLLAFRLTPMAGLLLHVSSKGRAVLPGGQAMSAPIDDARPEQDTTSVVKMSETGDVLISSSSAAWPLIELLEDFAEVAGVESGRLRYRLTATSLSKAISSGLRPTDLLQMLHLHAEPGESLTAILGQLERRIASYGRIRLYTDVMLLEVADPAVLRELSATTPLEEQVVRTLHPTLLILRRQGAEDILQELKRRGQPPLLHEEEDYGAE